MNGKYLWLILPLVAVLLVAPAIADNVSVTATVPYYISVVFNYNTVDFKVVNPGATYSAPGQESGIYNVSVDTNADLAIQIYMSSAWPLKLEFGATTVLSDLPTVTRYEVTTFPVTINEGVGAGSWTHYHGYWLTVPAYTAPGTYSNTVIITYQLV